MERAAGFLNFPSESIGWIEAVGAKDIVAAKGQIDATKASKFKAGRLISEHPEYFAGFGKSDLKELTLPKALAWDSRHFAEISKLKSLENIKASGVIRHKSDLKWLEQLPALFRWQ